MKTYLSWDDELKLAFRRWGRDCVLVAIVIVLSWIAWPVIYAVAPWAP